MMHKVKEFITIATITAVIGFSCLVAASHKADASFWTLQSIDALCTPTPTPQEDITPTDEPDITASPEPSLTVTEAPKQDDAPKVSDNRSDGRSDGLCSKPPCEVPQGAPNTGRGGL